MRGQDSGQGLASRQDVRGEAIGRAVRIPRLHRGQNGAVLLVGSSPPVEAAPGCEQVPCPGAVEVGDRGEKARHPAGHDEGPVELPIRLLPDLDALPGLTMPERGPGCVQTAFGLTAGHRVPERKPFQHGAHGCDLEYVPRREGGDANAPPWLAHDEARGLQSAERLADGNVTRAERDRDVVLAEAVAGGEGAGDDPRLKVARDLGHEGPVVPFRQGLRGGKHVIIDNP